MKYRIDKNKNVIKEAFLCNKTGRYYREKVIKPFMIKSQKYLKINGKTVNLNKYILENESNRF
jgi:hypothetical protein